MLGIINFYTQKFKQYREFQSEIFYLFTEYNHATFASKAETLLYRVNIIYKCQFSQK